jgi:hypothetical protein
MRFHFGGPKHGVKEYEDPNQIADAVFGCRTPSDTSMMIAGLVQGNEIGIKGREDAAYARRER